MTARTIIANLCLLAVFGSMQPQLNAASHVEKHERQHKHFSSSSSHHKDENRRKKTSKCCKKIVRKLNKIEKKFGCDETHIICSVPTVIDRPGKWCVKEDLVYNGSGSAITITASNVTLNFHNHSLTLTNTSAVGVFAQDVQELTIENDIIQSRTISTDPLSAAFYLVNCEKITLDNIFTANTFFGVHAVNTRDLFVTHSRFKDHIGGGDIPDLLSGGLNADACSAVVVEESTFSGAGEGFFQGNGSSQTIFRGGSTACRISNCEFAGVEGAVRGFGVDGLVVENCVTQTAAGKRLTDDPSSFSAFLPLIQLGSGLIDVGIQASNVTVRNCLLNGNLAFSTECLDLSPNCTVEASFQVPISIGQANMILLDNCEIGNFFVTNPDGLSGGLININVDSDKVRPNEITIRGCTLRGDTVFGFQHGIVFGRTDNILIEGCLVTGGHFGILPSNTSKNIVIRDSTIEGTGHCSLICGSGLDGLTIANNHVMDAGFNSMQIVEQGGSVIKNVVVEGNTIANGFSSGIFLSGTENSVVRNNIIDTVGASGIPVENGVNTTVQGNTVSNSGFNGIQILNATNTLVQDNISSFNGASEPANGIVIVTGTKTSLIGNNTIGNTQVGIVIALGSTDTLLQNNTATQNNVAGIIDLDNTGEVTAFFNKSCDNGVVNCVNIPLVQAPGDTTYIAGANLCCIDPENAKAKKGAKNAINDPKALPGEIEKVPDLSLLPAS